MKCLRLYAATVLAASLAACSSNDAPQAESTDTDTYGINVSLILSSSASRADSDYEDGTKEESNINVVYFTFYNEYGTRVASTSISSPQLIEDTSSALIENKFTATVAFQLPVGSAMPAYVMAYANPQDPTYAITASLSDVKGLIRSYYKSGSSSNPYFIMSNATYFNADGEEQIEVETPAECFFDVESEDGGTKPSVTIYLERLAAKVEVNTEDAEIPVVKVTDWETEEVKTIQFVLDNWAINCTEKQTYFLKHFNSQIYTSTYVKESMTEAEAASKVFAGWNSPENHRCYWANSLSSYLSDDEYPQYSDELYAPSNGVYQPFLAVDEATNEYSLANSPLNYVTFNEITNKPNSYDYCFELAPSIYNLPSALTSVILAGHYETDDGDRLDSFYIISGNHDSDVSSGTYYTEKTLKQYFIGRCEGYLFNADGTSLSLLDDDLLDDFELAHPYITKNNTNHNVSRLVTLNIKSTAAAKYSVIDSEGNNVKVSIDATSETYYEEVNKKLYAYADCAEAFTDGCAYFHWAIRHLNNSKTQGKGYYGVIRNHWYKVTVSKIEGLGTGVFDPDVPIVPQEERNEYGINANVKVLAWRIVPQTASVSK